MNICIFYDSTNTWLGTLKRFKPDGKEFVTMAKLCSDWYNGRGDSVIMFDVSEIGDNKTALQKRTCMLNVMGSLIAGNEVFDRVLFFMHGHPKALNRRMITKLNIVNFADKLKRMTMAGASVVFYSCKTAKKKKNGFAADICTLSKVNVIGHLTSGHTVFNPYKRMFAYPRCFYLDHKDLWPVKRKEWKKYKSELKYNPEKCFELVEGAMKGVVDGIESGIDKMSDEIDKL